LIRNYFFSFLRINKKHKRLIGAVKHIAGYRPFRIELFQLVTRHASAAKTLPNGFKESNERLEYLGDAILGAVVADYLFKKYPFKDEGFLTEIRSRIVNRESLGQLARKVGINQLSDIDIKSNNFNYKFIYGDMIEAFIGAVYLDRGYRFCRNFIIKKLLIPHFDLDQIIENNTNYKSILIEWAQKENKEISFEIIKIDEDKRKKEFHAVVQIDEISYSEGIGLNKKKAEQMAAFKACKSLALI
jgi:ribonuclease-3